jgi:hypothetical protein
VSEITETGSLFYVSISSKFITSWTDGPNNHHHHHHSKQVAVVVELYTCIVEVLLLASAAQIYVYINFGTYFYSCFMSRDFFKPVGIGWVEDIGYNHVREPKLLSCT